MVMPDSVVPSSRVVGLLQTLWISHEGLVGLHRLPWDFYTGRRGQQS